MFFPQNQVGVQLGFARRWGVGFYCLLETAEELFLQVVHFMSVQLRHSLLLLPLKKSITEDEGGAGRLVGPQPEGAIGRVVVHPPATTVLGSV